MAWSFPKASVAADSNMTSRRRADRLREPLPLVSEQLLVAAQVTAHAQDGLGMQLVHPRLGHGQYLTDLLEGQPLIVVERDDETLPLRQAINRHAELTDTL